MIFEDVRGRYVIRACILFGKVYAVYEGIKIVLYRMAYSHIGHGMSAY